MKVSDIQSIDISPGLTSVLKLNTTDFIFSILFCVKKAEKDDYYQGVKGGLKATPLKSSDLQIKIMW